MELTIGMLRCEWHAEMVCFNSWLNVTITHREVTMPSSKVTVIETLRDKMRIQWLQLSKRGCRLVFAQLLWLLQPKA